VKIVNINKKGGKMNQSEKELEIEKRKKEVEKAFLMATVDGSKLPSEKTQELFKKYISLEISYEELGKMLLEI
jgi:hypothetical protein